MDRRDFGRTVGLGLTGAVVAAAAAPARSASVTASAAAASHERPAGSAPFTIGMIIFERMTALDMVPPQDAFAHLPGARVHVLAKSRAMITSDSGLKMTPEMTLDEAPEVDLLFIGGGAGTTELMEDPAMLGFLQQRAPRAQWITSVCTGALVLGAAGLLRGYKAATHWASMEVLPLLGAEPVHERVVIDRNRITGGGVTAGLDFALVVIAKLFGERIAQVTQLGEEYDPHPPFQAGSPRTAPADVVAEVRARMAKTTEARCAAARRAALKFS